MNFQNLNGESTPNILLNKAVWLCTISTGQSLYPVRPDGDHPRLYGDQKMYKVAGKREHNARKSQKITNLDKAAFLLRHVRSYHVLTAHPPPPLRAYGVSFEIYGLGNGDHGRSRGALTTIMRFLPHVFYVYRECTATSGRFYNVHTATFGDFQRIIVVILHNKHLV